MCTHWAARFFRLFYLYIFYLFSSFFSFFLSVSRGAAAAFVFHLSGSRRHSDFSAGACTRVCKQYVCVCVLCAVCRCSFSFLVAADSFCIFFFVPIRKSYSFFFFARAWLLFSKRKECLPESYVMWHTLWCHWFLPFPTWMCNGLCFSFTFFFWMCVCVLLRLFVLLDWLASNVSAVWHECAGFSTSTSPLPWPSRVNEIWHVNGGGGEARGGWKFNLAISLMNGMDFIVDPRDNTSTPCARYILWL